MTMSFATVIEGPLKGELVRYEIGIGSPAYCKNLLPWQARGLSYTASGYGACIPTPHMVRTIDQKWRRVYATCFSNVSTLWIVQNGEKIIVDLV